jgi:hypothetical protein
VSKKEDIQQSKNEEILNLEMKTNEMDSKIN